MTLVVLTDKPTILADDSEWTWRDRAGKPIVLGSWVRTAAQITAPIGMNRMHPAKRQLDYGRVYELLTTGDVKVEWVTDTDDSVTATTVVVELTADLQLSTEEASWAFLAGRDEGWHDGHRRGRLDQVNDLRAFLGMPELLDEKFDALVEQGRL